MLLPPEHSLFLCTKSLILSFIFLVLHIFLSKKRVFPFLFIRFPFQKEILGLFHGQTIKAPIFPTEQSQSAVGVRVAVFTSY